MPEVTINTGHVVYIDGVAVHAGQTATVTAAEAAELVKSGTATKASGKRTA